HCRKVTDDFGVTAAWYKPYYRSVYGNVQALKYLVPRRYFSQVILERMTNILCGNSFLLIHVCFKWQNHQHLINRVTNVNDTLAVPRPYLRRNVIDHRNTLLPRNCRCPEVKPGIIHKNQQIGAALAQHIGGTSQQLANLG